MKKIKIIFNNITYECETFENLIDYIFDLVHVNKAYSKNDKTDEYEKLYSKMNIIFERSLKINNEIEDILDLLEKKDFDLYDKKHTKTSK